MALNKYTEEYVRKFFASGEPGKVSMAKRYLESQGLRAEDYGYVDPEAERIRLAEIAAEAQRVADAEAEAEAAAVGESVSRSPYEDGSASASFYGNQSFADIGAAAATNWWADDSTAWWDVKDPAAFFGVKGIVPKSRLFGYNNLETNLNTI